MPQPPISTLFPTRRSSDLHFAAGQPHHRPARACRRRLRASRPRFDLTRSEEHTSELQSRPPLVCRLLLEKKNSYVELGEEEFTSTLKIKGHDALGNGITQL